MIFRALLLVVVGAAFYFLWRLAEVKLKAGVSIEGASWRMFWAAIIADSVYQENGAEAVITSGADGKHSRTSKHYPENNASGLVEALDFRTWNVLHPGRVALRIREKLGPDYDVVLESDHIHIEYDPKRQA